MPTKRTFDLIVLTGLLMHAAIALPKMWAAREASEGDGGFATKTASAVLGLVS